MEKKTDRRVRKTRAQLQKGLIKIMKTKDIKDITVKELVDYVDINRSTFYLHYNSTYDILAELEQMLIEAIQEVFDCYPESHTEEETFSFISNMLHIVFDNLETCQVIFGPHGDLAFTKRIQDILDQKISERLLQLLGSDFKTSKYLSSFYVNGCMGILNTWQFDENRLTPDEMAKICYGLVMNTIKHMKE